MNKKLKAVSFSLEELCAINLAVCSLAVHHSLGNAMQAEHLPSPKMLTSILCKVNDRLLESTVVHNKEHLNQFIIDPKEVMEI